MLIMLISSAFYTNVCFTSSAHSSLEWFGLPLLIFSCHIEFFPVAGEDQQNQNSEQ